jgi:hypothetical protein
MTIIKIILMMQSFLLILGIFENHLFHCFFCLKELPLWDNKVEQRIFISGLSNELEEDIIKYKGADLSVEHEYELLKKK